MSIKMFGKGLGIVDHPFDTSKGDVTSGGVILNNKLPKSLNNPSINDIKEILIPQSLPGGDSLHTTLKIPHDDVRTNFEIHPQPKNFIDLHITPQVFSAETGPIPFETLFHDFDIEAYPFYNFWVPDELNNDRDERGSRKIEDLPRFVKITWKIAPNLPDPEERMLPKVINVRATHPVAFSNGNVIPSVHVRKGIAFTPDHLQPSGFERIKGIIANGHLAPGVLETIVEMPLHNTGLETHEVFTQTNPINHFNEDIFLTHPGLDGISVNELKAQITQLTNGIANMSTPTPIEVSSDLREKKSVLVDGKFMMVKSLKSGGHMQLTSIHPSSPSLSFSSRTATANRKNLTDDVLEMAGLVTQPESVNDVKATAQIKVKFVNPSIGGLINSKKINLMSAPHHLETMVAIAPSLASLETLSRTDLHILPRNIDPPSLPSPKIKPLEYIGYVIEKYKRQSSGAFIKVEEINIPTRESNFCIDTKVLYGEVYRYRIKAIIRWTRTREHSIAGKDLTTLVKFGSHTSPLATHKSSYFNSEWGHEWAYASCIDDQPPLPPDELTVRPESHRKRVVVTFRLPDNSQRDILKMRLYRKIQDENGRDISDWQQVIEGDSVNRTIDFAPQNVIYFDTDVDFIQKAHMLYVYAAQCISRHGEDSTLSEQLAVKLNEDYFSRGEFPTQFISSPGVRLDYFGAFSTSPPKKTSTEIILTPPPTRIGKTPGTTTAMLSGRNTMGNMMMNEGSYALRIQSLDTGETIDIPLLTKFRNIQTRQDVSRFDHFVPAHAIAGKNSDNFDSKKASKLKNDLIKRQDEKSEDNEVLPRDRSLPKERW